MRVLPYGTWPSPISAEVTTRAGLRFADRIAVDGEDVYWVEGRPQEDGRSVVVRRTADGKVSDLGPAEFNARTSAHEYGGAAYAVSGGVVYATHFPDQRLYRIDAEGGAEPVTAEPAPPRGDRFADLVISGTWAIAVRERHHAGGGEPSNELVRIDLGGGEQSVVAAGGDFYSSPRLSPDGTRLCWLTWNHPDMPWDGTEVWVGELSPDGHVTHAERVAGGRGESIFQPEWSPDGVLHLVSDRSGWWNLYRLGRAGLEPILPMEAEFGLPQWLFGYSRYAFMEDGRIVAAFSRHSGAAIAVIGDGDPRVIELPFAATGSTIAAGTHGVYLIASGPDRATALVHLDVGTGQWDEVRGPEGPGIDPAYLSIPEPVTFATPDGPAHALYYPPTHPEIEGPPGELPPVIVAIHGGPTSSARPDLDPSKLYWTSRGIGIVDVDYGGSTGYGRAYRERLNGRWGIVDVRDGALAAAHLASAGKVDGDRLLIHGGSAGGYTTLLAMALRDEFAAGASLFGIADLETFAADTHKFESRYLDNLVGPYPQAGEVYRERSPVAHADRIQRPIILLQGMDDKVVPPAQAEIMCAALERRGVPYAYVAFQGEGHGFRAARNLITALESELSFYGQVLGFTPAGDLEPVAIVGAPPTT